MLRQLTILIIICLTQQNSWAVTKAPTLIRACLNVADSTVTIDYTSITDICGSFVEHHIYGSEGSAAFGLLNTQKSLSSTSVQFKLPNANPQWRFFFETRYKCNGTDTAKSNIFFLDSKPPAENLIDSVSIDVPTQKTVIGWQKNDSLDTKGYRIYTRSNGINSTLADTNSLFYVVNNQPSTASLVYALSAFDSCDLFSSISPIHSAMSLTASLDTCTKSASLTWSTYIGWPTEKQQVYISTNNAPFVPTTLQPNDVSFSYPGISFGDSVCFYIRAKNETGSSKSTSSNVHCVKLKQPIIPKTTYLSKVSVLTKTDIEIEAYVENTGVADSVVLYSVLTTDTRVGSLKLINGKHFYSWVDRQASTDFNSKTYIVRTFAPCLGGTSASLSSRSILLTIDDELLTWNSYINWGGGLESYYVYGYDGSTWNIVGSTSNESFTNTDTTLQCFYVEAVENTNAFGFTRTSKSNSVCAKRQPRFYIPNTLNPLSKNHTLRVISASVDDTQSTMVVFNRWGEQIFTTSNIKEGWSVDATSVFIPLGIYFYDIAIMDLNGNRHRLTGSVRVIR